MKNLSNEVKLDIFKYLNFNQLNVIQQTNKSFCGIVDRYKTELARKEVFALEIEWKYYVCKQVKCSSKSLHFQLNADTKAKWNDGLKQQIPVFISQPIEIHEDELDEAVNLFILFNYKEDNNKLPPKILHLQLKRYPKNIEELFFVRYWLEQLSSCYFENIKIKQAVFNPKIIDLLFDGSPPLQFYTKYFYLFGGYLNATFEFIYHHLKIFEPKGFYFEDTVGTLRGEIIKEEEKYLKIDQQNCQNIKEGKECSGENCEGCKDNNSYVVTKGEGKLFKSVEYEFYNIYVPNTLFHMLLIISVEDKKVLQILVGRD